MYINRPNASFTDGKYNALDNVCCSIDNIPDHSSEWISQWINSMTKINQDKSIEENHEEYGYTKQNKLRKSQTKMKDEMS